MADATKPPRCPSVDAIGQINFHLGREFKAFRTRLGTISSFLLTFCAFFETYRIYPVVGLEIIEWITFHPKEAAEGFAYLFSSVRGLEITLLM